MGEGVMQETAFALTPSPSLSPKGERNMTPLLMPRIQRVAQAVA